MWDLIHENLLYIFVFIGFNHIYLLAVSFFEHCEHYFLTAKLALQRLFQDIYCLLVIDPVCVCYILVVLMLLLQFPRILIVILSDWKNLCNLMKTVSRTIANILPKFWNVIPYVR